MRAFGMLLALVGAVGGCGVLNDGGGSTATPVDQDGTRFIGLGPLGRADRFNNVLTLYSRASDPQPTCAGCRSVRLVYDGYDPDGPVGVPRADAVRLNLSGACDGREPGAAVSLSAIETDNPWSAAESDMLVLAATPGACRSDGAVAVELVGDRCLNPTVPTCLERVVKESFTTTVEAVMALEYFDNRDYPNRRLTR